MYHQVYLGITHKHVNFKGVFGSEHHHLQVVNQLDNTNQVQLLQLIMIEPTKILILTLVLRQLLQHMLVLLADGKIQIQNLIVTVIVR